MAMAEKNKNMKEVNPSINTRRSSKSKQPPKVTANTSGSIITKCRECDEVCIDIPKKDEECSIKCDSCNSWIHRTCSNITPSAWNAISTNQNILYSCDVCLEKKGKEVNEIREIKELLKENIRETKNFMAQVEEKIYQTVDKMIEEKIGNQTQTQEKLDKMLKDVKETETNIEKKIQTEVKIYLDKANEKESRKNNLIIMRLPEQETENPEEELKKDEIEIKKIFDQTNPELKSELTKILNENKIKRLGRKKTDKTKPRPIKVTLPDGDMKEQIFKGCKNLKNSNFKNISIQNDLTLEEREEGFKLRQEMRERKEKGEDICIFRGKIIPVKDHPKNKN